MKYHDNVVQILNSYDDIFSLWKDNEGKYGSFTIKDFKISSGQDPKNRIQKGQKYDINSNGEMTFSIGRHKTKEVADWWRYTIGIKADNCTFNATPDELNFAMIGELELNVKGGILGNNGCVLRFTDVAFAQGQNFESRNNWWFGGPNCKNILSSECSRTLGQASVIGTSSDGRIVKLIADRSISGASVNTISMDYYAYTENNADWMAKLDGTLELRDVVYPASHDSGMSELHHCDITGDISYGNVKTQALSIKEQLLCGCRYFDIRVDYDNNELVTYHRTASFGANGEKLRDIFNDAVSFLNEHKQEFIMFKLSHIRDYLIHDKADIIDAIDEFLDDYTSVFFKDTNYDNDKNDTATKNYLHTKKISELRGKIIILCDSSEFQNKNIIKPHNGIWGIAAENGDVGEYQMCVFDSYSNTKDYQEMHDDQIKKLKDNCTNNENDKTEKLFLLSWTLTSATPTKTVHDLAMEANSHLSDTLENDLGNERNPKEHNFPVFAYLDYIDSELCKTIIKYNEV